MKKADIFWQTYLNLEKEAIELSKYIYITDVIPVNSNGNIVNQSYNSQLETFSPYIADLLVRCCVQIEAISKELYFENGGTKSRGDTNLYFDEDCLKLIDIKWQTHNKTVMIVAPFFNLTKNDNCILKPLKEAHKRQGTYWEKAYQAVKHDRYISLQKGNIKAFLQALAALYLLNLYYRNDSWVTKYHDLSKTDYSMGSSIFTVKAPIVADQLWYGNKTIISESPYVVNYNDTDYQRIKQLQEKESKELNDYWECQPEIQEKDFQTQLQKTLNEEKNKSKVIYFQELGKYRLNKKIPLDLTFDEKKSILINSEEWNGWIHKNNNHLTEEELTEENIQHEIDSVGSLWGVEIMNKYQKNEWISIALNSGMCRIYIP